MRIYECINLLIKCFEESLIVVLTLEDRGLLLTSSELSTPVLNDCYTQEEIVVRNN